MAAILMSVARNAYHLGAGQIKLSQFRTPDPCMPTGTGQIAMSQLLCKPHPAPVILGIRSGVGYLLIDFSRPSLAYHAVTYNLFESIAIVPVGTQTTGLKLVASNITTGYKRIVSAGRRGYSIHAVCSDGHTDAAIVFGTSK